MDIRDVEQLERRLETMQTARSKAEGAKEQIAAQLKSEFGLDSLEAAKAQDEALGNKLRALDQQAYVLVQDVSKVLTDAGF